MYSISIYIYELSGVPIANETQLGNNNWSPINVGSNNNPSLINYKAYWVNVTEVNDGNNPVSQTIFYYSNNTTTTITDLTSITSKSYKKDLSLNSVYIGSNVTTIGEGAFLDATSLTSVIFATGSQLESIGQNTFSGASSLTSITIPSSVTNIGVEAFYRASSLTNVSLYLETIKYLNTANPSLSIPEGGIMPYFYGSTGGNVTITVL